MNTAMTTHNFGERPEASQTAEGEVVRSGKGSVFISAFNFTEIRFTIYKDYLVFSLKGKKIEVTVGVKGNDIIARDDVGSLQISVRLKNPLNFKRIEKFEGNALVLEYIGSVNVKVRKEEVVKVFIDGEDHE